MNTTLSAEDVQAKIVAVMERSPGRTYTHAGMAVELPDIALQRIGSNMFKLSKDGILELVREGWDHRSKTKQYRLANHDRN